jgi:zinc/manganese transport system substrate-binding protein
MFKIVGLILAFVLILAVGSPTPTTTAMQRPLNVVSSFSVIGHFVDKVGGDRIANHVLVGADTDSHTYESTPQDVVALRDAAILIENGLGFEPWMDRLHAASGSRAARVGISETLGALRMVGHEDHGSEEEDEDAEEVDPHVWHDVRNAIQMVGTTRDALIMIDATNASTYTANAAAYIAELNALDTWVIEQVSLVPPANRKLVTSHDTFGYFAQRYGFTIVGSALGSISTEVADPSAGQVAELVSEIKSEQVPAIFAENVSNPRLMNQIASAAGVRLVADLYTDALSASGTEGESYVSMMRHNVTRIVGALRGA